MAASSSCLVLLFLVVAVALASAASAALSSTFYDTSCPNAMSTIRSGVNSAVAKEARMGASLLRLHFHDCFVQGCDASVLLNDTSSFTGEQTAFPNSGSIRGFTVVDDIKAKVEAVCPGVVSCADILAVAARDSVVALGGPSWSVLLGRRDSTTASLSLANSDLPRPNFDLVNLTQGFANKGLSTTDMVALSGGHTIGQARCTSFRAHIYNDTNINSAFATSRQANCPFSGGDDNLAPLDTMTATVFDNDYYSNLLSKKGLMHSDQVLFNNGSTDSTVSHFASSASAFTSAFTSAIVKMGNISPLTGTDGEIRLKCWEVNSS